MRQFCRTLDLQTAHGRASALDAVGHHVNFYLAAQDGNDIDLQREYGEMVASVMAASYPQWTGPVPMPPLAPGEKIRVGYVSGCLSRHSVYKTHGAWIRRLDHEQFDVFAYFTGTLVDECTDEARRACVRFVHDPGDLEAVAQAALADRLHVLIFLDLGMTPVLTQLAGLRLAPLQAASWGHPVTSGLPTIDYFVSSELMEPDDGQAQYTERLVRLPGIGVCCETPKIPTALLWKTRRDFGLREDAAV